MLYEVIFVSFPKSIMVEVVSYLSIFIGCNNCYISMNWIVKLTIHHPISLNFDSTVGSDHFRMNHELIWESNGESCDLTTYYICIYVHNVGAVMAPGQLKPRSTPRFGVREWCNSKDRTCQIYKLKIYKYVSHFGCRFGDTLNKYLVIYAFPYKLAKNLFFVSNLIDRKHGQAKPIKAPKFKLFNTLSAREPYWTFRSWIKSR